MTDPGVQPALMDHEWADAIRRGDEVDTFEAVVSRHDFALARGRHSVAALALYQQPFGFTREDVHVLRFIAGAWQAYADDGKSLSPALLSLTARIAALLPPEEG